MKSMTGDRVVNKGARGTKMCRSYLQEGWEGRRFCKVIQSRSMENHLEIDGQSAEAQDKRQKHRMRRL